jgi:hypothetical protein
MKLKLSLLVVFISIYSWSQTNRIFTTSGTFTVPAGVTSITGQAWGGGGSGGGASGASLLFGRGAAGGGGGAYASSVLTVTPGDSFNVVVAGQTAGTTGANGTAGGSSSIASLSVLLKAAGGSGGDANNAGGTPLGGSGGSIANSIGTTRYAGFDGIIGNTGALLSILLTSGAGGSGANFGGAGGAGISSLILGNAPGNTGSAPGGGGSGAINSALGAAQAGGVGAAGQVIISYTCPTYSITGTTAANVCLSVGTTSAVTVTSSAASLPVGTYVVTYNRSSPSATALTANLIVTTAGTGTFSASGLTTAGSGTLTITKIESGSCSSAISTNNTATILVSPASVGGVVSGGTTINSGNTSGLLTLSGHTGSVVKWQSSVSPFTTWTDIVNTNTTYTSGVLTETTQFRAVVQSGVCDVAYSAATTVTVRNQPTITTASIALVCLQDSSSTPAFFIALSYSATTGSPVTYSIVWDSSPANNLAAVTDAALPANPIFIAIPAGTSFDTFTGTITVKDANGISSTGAPFSVKIAANATITTTGTIAPVTTSTTLQNTTLSYSASRGNPSSYSINWDSDANNVGFADQSSTSATFSFGGGSLNTINVPANVPAGTYSGSLTVINGNCDESYPVSITINPSGARGVENTIISETTDLKSLKNPITVSALNKVITVETPNQVIDKVYVFDVSGNLIYKKNAVKGSKLVIDNLRSGNQILVVKVILNNDQTETRKVIF